MRPAFGLAIVLIATIPILPPWGGQMHDNAASIPPQPIRQFSCTIAGSFYSSDVLLLDTSRQNTPITSLARILPDAARLSPTRPMWLQDGQSLLFQSGRDNMLQLYMANLLTQEVRLVTDDIFRFEQPSLAPDGRTLAYVTDFLGASPARSNTLVLLDLVRGTRTTHTPFEGYYNAPRWSPDGTQLVFSFEGRDGREALYLMAADGGVFTVLVDERARASWSPDGKSLALTLRREGKPRLWRYTLADGALVSFGDDEIITPAWSPDGTQIVAVRRAGVSRSHLVLVDAETGIIRDLTEGLGDVQDTYPQWSPDGTQVAFISNRVRAIYSDVWLINADGTGARPLTRESGATGLPAWNLVTCADE